MCLTDGDSSAHTVSEGFGGGTKPLFAELHLTAWCYNSPLLKDVQFFKWEIINKSGMNWDSVYFAITCDPDLGDAIDDYVGSDTVSDMIYCYNADNTDGDGSGRTYGINPPASGIMLLRGARNYNSQTYYNYGARVIRVWNKNFPICERDPSNSFESNRMIRGFKNDGTPFVIPYTVPPQVTKYTFTGDPETGTGWTEYYGRVENCGGSLYGNITAPTPPGDRRMIISTGDSSLSIKPGEKQFIYAAQLVARGSSNLNSVTKLKQMCPVIKEFFEANFPVEEIPSNGTEIPTEFNLYQNYPNPFNPATKIKFSIPKSQFVTLKIYDALGREVSTLVNDRVAAGVYSVDWDATAYPSGIYFYSFNAGNFTQTRKMILIK